MGRTHLLPQHLGKEVIRVSSLMSQGLAQIRGELDMETLDALPTATLRGRRDDGLWWTASVTALWVSKFLLIVILPIKTIKYAMCLVP